MLVPCYITFVHSNHTMSIYTDNGYANRAEYLQELRLEYGGLEIGRAHV